MKSAIERKTSLTFFVMLSLAGHLAAGYLTGVLGPFDLRAPVPLKPAITVTLDASSGVASPLARAERVERGKKPDPATQIYTIGEKRKDDSLVASNRGEEGDRRAMREPSPGNPAKTVKPDSEACERVVAPPVVPETTGTEEADFSSIPVPAAKKLVREPVRTAEEFVPFAWEKLTYRITLFGIPVGTAVMEATNGEGEVRITARVTSNEAVSCLYPVDIYTDSRLMNGNYLMTRIRRHEGSTSSDTGYTLMLRERNAFWVDRLRNRYDNRPLPSEDVMDIIMGFYFLRNQLLDVGRSVLLPLFDSFEYAPTTVEVLRKEHLRLPWFREADTLVVHPVLKTEGFFGRSGEVFIWLTDDEKKVPVKMEAEIPLGNVTAEIVSAESVKTSEGARNGIAKDNGM